MILALRIARFTLILLAGLPAHIGFVLQSLLKGEKPAELPVQQSMPKDILQVGPLLWGGSPPERFRVEHHGQLG